MLERIRRALAGPSTAATGVLRTGSHGLDAYQDLLEYESQITVVDGDRDWLTSIVDANRPEQLQAQLWARAHEASAQAIRGRQRSVFFLRGLVGRLVGGSGSG